MRIYFPGFYTEAHRTEDRQVVLVNELDKLGIICDKECHPCCELVFYGSIYTALDKDLYHRGLPKEVPVIHYSWDIYPFQVTGPEGKRWREYLSLLKTCTEVWVPSFSCLSRLKEYTGRADGKVVLSSCNCWDLPDKRKPWDGGYVLDVMRKYPDPNKDAVRDACKELGIPCVESATSLPWPKFQKTVAGARLLVSAYYEASTGGLTLLEGYRLGKPVLLSNSPKNGASEYFKDRAYYFEWNSMASLLKRLRWYYDHATFLTKSDQKEWVEENYSDAAFAKRLAINFERVLNVRS